MTRMIERDDMTPVEAEVATAVALGFDTNGAILRWTGLTVDQVEVAIEGLIAKGIMERICPDEPEAKEENDE